MLFIHVGYQWHSKSMLCSIPSLLSFCEIILPSFSIFSRTLARLRTPKLSLPPQSANLPQQLRFLPRLYLIYGPPILRPKGLQSQEHLALHQSWVTTRWQISTCSCVFTSWEVGRVDQGRLLHLSLQHQWWVFEEVGMRSLNTGSYSLRSGIPWNSRQA